MTHPYHRDLVALCDHVISVAKLVKRQAGRGDLDKTLVPADCLARIAQVCERTSALTAAALVSRAVAYYVHTVCNTEPVPAALAKLLLSRRPIDPVPPPADPREGGAL